MADVPKRLCGPVAVTNAAVTYYTVPAATTTIVRHIHCVSVSASAATVTIGINGVTAALALYSAFTVPSNGTLDWSGFLVLNPGDILQALASANNVMNLTMSGVEIA